MGLNLCVFLQRLNLRNFRNFESEIVEFPERGAALIGDNGQGKTNLLEAIYYLEIFRSFRGARDEQLITFGREHFRVEGSLLGAGGGGEAVVAAGFAREGRRKKVSVDGREPERVGDAIGRVGAIVFTASDVEIVSGGPAGRRRFLDIALSLAERGYLATLKRYRQIVAQRNELLREGARDSEVAAWSGGLAVEGGRISAARARWIAANRERFNHHYAAISGGQEADLEYAPSVANPTGGDGVAGDEAWAASLRQALQRQADRERRRGMSLVGPHRDDVHFWVDGSGERVEMRGYGSAGQQRTAAIALRIVEAAALRDATGERPIVMLDDVFAELDPRRAERLVELFSGQEWGQVFVTSPKPTEIVIMESLGEYRISDGGVRPV